MAKFLDGAALWRLAYFLAPCVASNDAKSWVNINIVTQWDTRPAAVKGLVQLNVLSILMIKCILGNQLCLFLEILISMSVALMLVPVHRIALSFIRRDWKRENLSAPSWRRSQRKN